MSETNPSMRALPAKARIALVAPASPARPENIDAAINGAIAVFVGGCLPVRR